MSFRSALRALALTPALFALSPAYAEAPSDKPDTTVLIKEAMLSYPQTRRLDLTEDHFGAKVIDPYRWLENDVRQDDAVRQWVTAENAVTEDYLKTVPGREIFKKRMAALYDYGRYSAPTKAGNRYFFTYNTGLQNQSPLFVREGLRGKQRMLLDPNAFSRDNATALAEWKPSPNGRYLLYAVQDGGTDWRTLALIDVASGKALSDRVEWVKFSNLSWDAEGQGFFYSRFAAPEQGATFQSLNENQQIYYHRVGSEQTEDRLIYETPDQPKLGHSAKVTDDGKWLVITSRAGTDEKNDVTLVSLAGSWQNMPITPQSLIRGRANEWTLVGSRGDTLWFITDKSAPRSRIVTLDAGNPRQPASEIVPQGKDTLAAGSLVGDRIILAYLENARTVAQLVELNGKPVGDVPIPGVGTAAGFGGKSGDPETFFSFSSFTRPSTVFRYDTATGKIEIFAQPDLAFDPDNFVSDQVFYPSKDGTKIPMFVIRRKDIAASARPAPTLLYGYGGFNISMTPGFSPTRLAWLEQGGVLAIANLRGGGEYGKAWHDAGRRENKQNVFDDFIAAGEFLKASGITGQDQLAIEGRSNGGLLVGAVVNQRPDLFAAALPGVGVMDMLRFDRFTAGRYWVDDYGYPSKRKDFRVLYSYSPYHNIAPGREYPAILVTTADTDDRVVPGHSFKYAAALQAADIGRKPHLIRIETRAGHGSGKPTDKVIEEFSDMYAFIAQWTGLKITDPAS
ncbi:S9 family peptidase [Sphingobium sp. SCG-1]|uniref:prolyl oligopeptidase family serine peptidase n=1 Tax=Sphingobium sp. SCG-1 TaxID=2072936 RepID=UPI000CD6BC06|nr:prolyl oligopeptidase family serine peptidase [Sphingobium sp. SCG-1]AUW58254.1 S9 family peptidase [Sphingobium sp. SCG-1]